MHMALDQGCRPDRHEISEKAQRLFAERGYDRVSMSEVAGAVGLSFEELRRMVPNKEALVLGASADGPIWILDRFESLPKDMPVWRALKAAFSERIALFSEERMRLWRSAVLTAPPELQQLVSLGVIERAALISMVAERMDVDPKDDPRPSVMVTEVISTVAQAYEIWLYDESSRPLMELINESLDQLPD
jgi:AcrR family transcriptional regulator